MFNLLHKLFCFSLQSKREEKSELLITQERTITFWINNMKLWNIEKYHSVMDLRWHLSENQWTKLADCDHTAFSGITHTALKTSEMTWYARSAGKNMGWLRHVLTLLSVVIFVSINTLMSSSFRWNCFFVTGLSIFLTCSPLRDILLLLFAFYYPQVLWENEEVWWEIIIFSWNFMTIFLYLCTSKMETEAKFKK